MSPVLFSLPCYNGTDKVGIKHQVSHLSLLLSPLGAGFLAVVDVLALAAPPAAGLGLGLAAVLTVGFFDDITNSY